MINHITVVSVVQKFILPRITFRYSFSTLRHPMLNSTAGSSAKGGTTKSKGYRGDLWLQLKICETVLESFLLIKDAPESTPLADCKDEACHVGFAHPPLRVLQHAALASGNVICCQEFIFSGKNGGQRSCSRGDFHCR